MASCEIRKIAGCACAGNAGNVFSATSGYNDPDMHHSTCVTHVPWCMPGSLTNGFLWRRWRGKRSRHSGACATRNFAYLVRGPLNDVNFGTTDGFTFDIIGYRIINSLRLNFIPENISSWKTLIFNCSILRFVGGVKTGRVMHWRDKPLSWRYGKNDPLAELV